MCIRDSTAPTLGIRVKWKSGNCANLAGDMIAAAWKVHSFDSLTSPETINHIVADFCPEVPGYQSSSGS
eukprot:4906835-Amphidinium_carterae.1